MHVYAIRADLIRLGMREGEVREALGPPYLVQLAGASMVYRWQDAYLEADANELRQKLGGSLDTILEDA